MRRENSYTIADPREYNLHEARRELRPLLETYVPALADVLGSEYSIAVLVIYPDSLLPQLAVTFCFVPSSFTYFLYLYL